MEEAVAEDRRFRASPHGWLVRRFVLPASRFEELGDELVPLAIVVDADSAGRPWPEDPRVSAVELKPGVEVGRLAGPQKEVYVELAAGEDLLEEKLGLLAASGMRAKVRCGGERVPAVDELGGFIRRCRALRLPFKATAGLHHPVRGGSQHGFLNVAAAALFGDEEQALSDEDPGSFSLTAEAFSWRGRSAGPDELTQLRRELFAGFGSCSAQEPADELVALGFLDGSD